MAGSSREKLIEAATGLFYDGGFHGVGIDQIIAEVGVTKTTFYKHFESKDDLIVAVLEERDRIETADMDEGMSARGGGCPRGELLAIFDLLHEWLQDEAFRGCMFMNAAAAFPLQSDPVHRAAAAHNANLFAQVRRRAEAAGARDPDALARHIMLLLAGALISRHVTGDLTAALSAKNATAALLERQLPPVHAATA